MAYDPQETAWRVHSAIGEWTGKVDSKASFALTIESAALAGVVSITGKGHRLHNVHGRLHVALFWGGIGLLIVSVIAAALVVMPDIKRRDTSNTWQRNIIFFGHLRRWNISALKTKIETTTEDEILEMLARQLRIMSEIAWKKHNRIQLSMATALVGMTAIGICYVLS